MTSPATLPSSSHERELLDPARRQKSPCLVEGDARCCGDEPLTRRHQRLDEVTVLACEQVARGQQAEQPALGVDDDESGDGEPVSLCAGLARP